MLREITGRQLHTKISGSTAGYPPLAFTHPLSARTDHPQGIQVSGSGHPGSQTVLILFRFLSFCQNSDSLTPAAYTASILCGCAPLRFPVFVTVPFQVPLFLHNYTENPMLA